MAGMEACKNSFEKLACGWAMADSRSERSRTPEAPPYRSICWRWISSTSSSDRNNGSTAAFRGALFRQPLEGLAVTPVGSFLSSVELRPALRRCRGGYDQALSVGADVERSIGVDLEQIENGPVDDQRQAVPLPLSVFTMPPVTPMTPHRGNKENFRSSCWRRRDCKSGMCDQCRLAPELDIDNSISGR